MTRDNAPKSNIQLCKRNPLTNKEIKNGWWSLLPLHISLLFKIIDASSNPSLAIFDISFSWGVSSVFNNLNFWEGTFRISITSTKIFALLIQPPKSIFKPDAGGVKSFGALLFSLIPYPFFNKINLYLWLPLKLDLMKASLHINMWSYLTHQIYSHCMRMDTSY